MICKNIFVTVGTTEFDSLIDIILDCTFIKQLKNVYACEKLTVQYGNSLNAKKYENFAKNNSTEIKIVVFGLKPSIKDEVNGANLVISHAGAGSCLEVLNAHLPLIVVVNDNLMGNHQTELAEKLYSDGYLYCCLPETLLETISKCDLTKLIHYPDDNIKRILDFIDSYMIGY